MEVRVFKYISLGIGLIVLYQQEVLETVIARRLCSSVLPTIAKPSDIRVKACSAAVNIGTKGSEVGNGWRMLQT